jgi:hypothetical protein
MASAHRIPTYRGCSALLAEFWIWHQMAAQGQQYALKDAARDGSIAPMPLKKSVLK